MKKNGSTAIIIAGLMSAILLVACGSGKEPSSDSTNGITTTTSSIDEANYGDTALEKTDNITYRTDTFLGCTYQVPEDWDDPVTRNEYYEIYDLSKDNQISLSYVRGNSADVDWEEFRESQVADMNPDEFDYRDSGLITEGNVEGVYISSFMHASNGANGYIYACYINAKDEGIIMLSKANATDDSLYSEEFDHILKTFDTSGFILVIINNCSLC